MNLWVDLFLPLQNQITRAILTASLNFRHLIYLELFGLALRASDGWWMVVGGRGLVVAVV